MWKMLEDDTLETRVSLWTWYNYPLSRSC